MSYPPDGLLHQYMVTTTSSSDPHTTGSRSLLLSSYPLHPGILPKRTRLLTTLMTSTSFDSFGRKISNTISLMRLQHTLHLLPIHSVLRLLFRVRELSVPFPFLELWWIYDQQAGQICQPELGPSIVDSTSQRRRMVSLSVGCRVIYRNAVQVAGM